MATKIPEFTYSGTYDTMLKNGHWYIFFKTSGTLKMTYGRYGDVYLHGGGGCGGDSANPCGGGGGAGGYLATHTDVRIEAGKEYSIVVGDGGTHITRVGGASSAFGFSVSGGGTGGDGGWSEGNGGAGGVGGSGNGGTGGHSTGGSGSSGGSNTTYAFNDSALGLLYGGGGAGGAPRYGGDGYGGTPYGAEGSAAAAANTGAGGGGANWTDGEYTYMGWGGSGIVILRSTQDDELPVKFNGKTLQRIVFNGEEVKSLIFNGTTIFMDSLRRWFKRFGQRTRFAWHAG